MTGRVTKYFDTKGYGFIKPDGATKDIFVHIKSVCAGELRAGASVEFESGVDRDQRPHAVNVRVVE